MGHLALFYFPCNPAKLVSPTLASVLQRSDDQRDVARLAQQWRLDEAANHFVNFAYRSVTDGPARRCRSYIEGCVLLYAKTDIPKDGVAGSWSANATAMLFHIAGMGMDQYLQNFRKNGGTKPPVLTAVSMSKCALNAFVNAYSKKYKA